MRLMSIHYLEMDSSLPQYRAPERCAAAVSERLLLSRAPAGLMEKQLMEGSTLHALRSSQPHTLVSCSEHMRAAL